MQYVYHDQSGILSKYYDIFSIAKLFYNAVFTSGIVLVQTVAL